MSQPRLERINLKSIRENPVALRAVNRQTEDYKMFADSVKSRGVLNPILVREIENGDSGPVYGVIEGLHRYTASLDAGFDSIPAQIVSMTDGEVMEAQLIGNAARIETKPVEYSKHLQRILAGNPYMLLSQLAAKLNRSESWIRERLGILKLTEAIGKMVDEGKINLTNAYALAKLPPEEQGNFLTEAQTMNPQEFGGLVATRKKEIEKARREGRDPNAAEFKPVPHLQKLSVLTGEMEKPAIGPVLCKDAKTPEEGFALGVRWALHMDAESIKVAQAKDEERKKLKEAEKAKNKAEREAKKAQEAAANSAAATVTA